MLTSSSWPHRCWYCRVGLLINIGAKGSCSSIGPRCRRQGLSGLLAPLWSRGRREEGEFEVDFAAISILVSDRHPLIELARLEYVCEVNHAFANEVWLLVVIRVACYSQHLLAARLLDCTATAWLSCDDVFNVIIDFKMQLLVPCGMLTASLVWLRLLLFGTHGQHCKGVLLANRLFVWQILGLEDDAC